VTNAMDPWLSFALAALATWRVTHLLVNEDGPADVVFHLRNYLADSFLGQLMDCFGCVSLWAAAGLAFFVTKQWPQVGVVWLALSGAAMFLEGLRPTPTITDQTLESSDGEQSDGVLR
jgi:Protein of unknown function (DUF1360)